jgi:DNA-binding XRE family transcriptional regulator
MPTPEEIAAARNAAGLTQTQAAALVYRQRLAWLKWESGAPIDMACWELFLIKTRKARRQSGV